MHLVYKLHGIFILLEKRVSPIREVLSATTFMGGRNPAIS